MPGLAFQISWPKGSESDMNTRCPVGGYPTTLSHGSSFIYPLKGGFLLSLSSLTALINPRLADSLSATSVIPMVTRRTFGRFKREIKAKHGPPLN